MMRHDYDILAVIAYNYYDPVDSNWYWGENSSIICISPDGSLNL